MRIFIALMILCSSSIVFAKAQIGNLVGRSEKLVESVKNQDFKLPKKELSKLVADGEFFFYQKNYSQAVVRLKMVEGEYRKQKLMLPGQVYFYLSKSLFEMGFYPSSLSYLKRLSKTTLTKILWPEVLALATELKSKTDLKISTSLFDSLLRKFGTSKTKNRISYLISRSFFLKGDNIAAYRFLKKINKGNEFFQKSSILTGLVYMQNGQMDPAIQALEYTKTLCKDKKDKECRKITDLCNLNLGRIHFHLGNYREAHDLYQEIPVSSKHFVEAHEEKIFTIIQDVNDSGKVDIKKIKLVRRNQELLAAAVSSYKMKWYIDLIYAENLVRLGSYKEARDTFSEVSKVFDQELKLLDKIKISSIERLRFFESIIPEESYDIGSINTDALIVNSSATSTSRLISEIAQESELVTQVVFWAREIKLINHEIKMLEEGLALFNKDEIQKNVELIPFFRGKKEKAYQIQASYSLALLENTRSIKGLFKGTKVENDRDLKMLFSESQKSAKSLSSLPLSTKTLKSRKDKLLSKISKIEESLLKRKLEYKILSANSNIINQNIQAEKVKTTDPLALDRFKLRVEAEKQVVTRLGETIAALERLIVKYKKKLELGTGIHQNEVDALKSINQSLRAEEKVLGVYAKFLEPEKKEKLKKLFKERKDLKAVELNLRQFDKFVKTWSKKNFKPYLETFDGEKKRLAYLKKESKRVKRQLSKIISNKRYDVFDHFYDRVRDYQVRAEAGIIETFWHEKGRVAEILDKANRKHLNDLKSLDLRFKDLGFE